MEKRDYRALTQCMAVAQTAPGMYLVYGRNGDEYTVDSWGENCTCPDFEYRDVKCKHIRRVEYQTGEKEIPDGLNRDAMDPLLVAEAEEDEEEDAGADAGDDKDATAVVTDGGTAEAESGDECDNCAALPESWPCADCAIHGDKSPPDV